MSKFSEAKRAFREVAVAIARGAPVYSQLLFSPTSFYWERSRDPERRVGETAVFLLANSIALSFIDYYAIRSIQPVAHWVEYAVGTVAYCTAIAVLVSALFAACSKAVNPSTSALTHLCNAICATSVLPWVSLLTFELHVAQVQAWMQHLHPPMSIYDLLIVIGYVWLSWQVYVGLRQNAQAPIGQSTLAVIGGLTLTLVVMQTTIVPIEMSLVHVWTT